MALVEIDRLTISRRAGRTPERALVTDVALTIDAGESVGLVGESGSGKSLTARACIGLLPDGLAAEGDATFAGRDLLAMAPRELRLLRRTDVAMIFQDPRAHINPVRTVGDFLTEALREGGASRAESTRTAVALLDQVGIAQAERRLTQYPHELSGGMLQRVMIASALAVRPRLLIADEPTTALDVTTQAEVVAILEDLRRELDMAVLFITHDLELAAATCDRVAVMYAGRIVERGSASLLQHEPLHPYTDGLLVSRPRIDRRVERLSAIPGRPQAAYEASAACAFVPRCAFAQDRCRQERPQRREVAAGVVACHRAEEIHARLATVQAAAT